MDDLGRQAEELAGKCNVKELYSITKTLAGVRKTTDTLVRAESGEVLTDQDQRKR